ncbi:MAG: methyltransferase domain-containing protein [Patescibacteria group bacterium]
MKKFSGTLLFLKASIKDFRNTGSFLPSSKYLAIKLAAPISFRPKMKVVELGAGNGSITKYLLNVLPSDARLFSVELNKSLANRLDSSIKDSRFTLIRGDASKLSEHLKEYNIGRVDYIISGLPLGNFPVKLRKSVYEEIIKCLDSNGIYTQFQYFMASLMEIRKHFKVKDISFEWRNIPPAFIYTCKLK